eukprot:10043567-Alexandrium_andersonii.AAC.1
MRAAGATRGRRRVTRSTTASATRGAGWTAVRPGATAAAGLLRGAAVRGADAPGRASVGVVRVGRRPMGREAVTGAAAPRLARRRPQSERESAVALGRPGRLGARQPRPPLRPRLPRP